MEILILDGYNVIHKIPKLEKHLNISYEDARMVLINFIKIWKYEHKFNDKIYIVFDGEDGFIKQSETFYNNIICIFTKTGEEADDYIVSMVRDTKNSKIITVISNDGKLKGRCSNQGASTEEPSFLLQPPKSYNNRLRNPQTKEEISNAKKKEINKLLKEKWNIE
jgi:predicted RNA-binding protein with PIN domain